MANYGTQTLSDLASYERKVLNPYAGMTAGQYAADMKPYSEMVRNDALTQRKDQFGSWLQKQAQAGQMPSRLDVAGQVAPFDPGEALDVMWERTYQGKANGGGVTANRQLTEENAAKAQEVAGKMDEIGRVILAKKANGENYDQDMFDMSTLQAEYVRYMNKPYVSAITNTMKMQGMDFGQEMATERMDWDKKKYGESAYNDLRAFVNSSLANYTKEYNEIADKFSKMADAFIESDATGNPQAAIVAMKAMMQSIDNSVVMKNEMSQIGSENILNVITGIYEKLFGNGRPFTQEDMANAWAVVSGWARGLNEKQTALAQSAKKKLEAELSRNNYVTLDDANALGVLIDETFKTLRVDDAKATKQLTFEKMASSKWLYDAIKGIAREIAKGFGITIPDAPGAQTNPGGQSDDSINPATKAHWQKGDLAKVGNEEFEVFSVDSAGLPTLDGSTAKFKNGKWVE